MHSNNSPRAEENFNIILHRLNSFRRYFISYANSCFYRFACESTKLSINNLLKSISSQIPILLFCKLKSGEGYKLKVIINNFLSYYYNLPYSPFQDIYDEIEINILYSNYLGGQIDHHIINIASLILAYYFNHSNQPSIGLYFYSLIDKFQNTKIKQSYRVLHLNFNQIKRQYKLLQANLMSKQIFQGIKRAFDRFQIFQKLVMFWFHQNLDHDQNQQFLQNINKILPAFSQINFTHYLIHYYKLLYKKRNQDEFKDKFVDAFKMLIFSLESQILKNRGIKEGLQILNEIILLNYNNHPLQKAYEQKCFLHFINGQNQKAIQTLQKAQQAYPQNNDIWYSCYGSIYLSIGKFRQSVSYFKQSLKINKKNQKSNFTYACICLSVNKYKIGLKYLFNAIKLNPSYLPYYLVLAFSYNEYYQMSNIIQDKLYIINNLIPRNIEFKFKGNVAIYQLCTKRYQQSYKYLCSTLQQASNQIDYNGEDLSLIYYYRMLLQVFDVYHPDDDQCLMQIGFYILILKDSATIRQKYINNLQSQGDKQEIYKQISSIIINILADINRRYEVFNKIKHFTQEHRYAIYVFIFKSLLQQNRIDPLDIFQCFKQVQNQLSKLISILEIQLTIKKSRIESIMKFITPQESKSSKRRQTVYQQFIPSQLTKRQKNNYLFAKTQFNTLNFFFNTIKNTNISENQNDAFESYLNLLHKCSLCQSLKRKEYCVYAFIRKHLKRLLQLAKYFPLIVLKELAKFQDKILKSQKFSSHEIAKVTYEVLYKEFDKSVKLGEKFKQALRQLIDSHNYYEFKKKVESCLEDDEIQQKSEMSLFDRDQDEDSSFDRLDKSIPQIQRNDNIAEDIESQNHLSLMSTNNVQKSHQVLVHNYLKQNKFRANLGVKDQAKHLLSWLFYLDQFCIILKDIKNFNLLQFCQIWLSEQDNIWQCQYLDDMLVINIQQKQLFASSKLKVQQSSNQQLIELFCLIENHEEEKKKIQILLNCHRRKIIQSLEVQFKRLYLKCLFSKQQYFYYQLFVKNKINYQKFSYKIQYIWEQQKKQQLDQKDEKQQQSLKKK